MRTTVDLPDDLHRVAREIAHEEGLTLSEVVGRLMRTALGARSAVHIDRDPVSGLPVVRLGRPLTSADVRTLSEHD